MKIIVIWILNLIFFVLFTPLVTVFLSLCYLYRKIVKLILQKTKGEEFGGLLEGTDCVWAVEDERAFSVINVLAVLEVKPGRNGDQSQLLEDLKTLVSERLVAQNFDKLCWLRDQKYGYYYWRKAPAAIDLNECVRWLGGEHNGCDGTCGDVYGGYLRKLINETCNQPLPNHHCVNWEILVGRNCPKCPVDLAKPRSVPLLFRIHHSLGDGVALLRLLLEAIADSNMNATSPVNIIIDPNSATNGESVNLISQAPALPSGIVSEPPPEIIYYTHDLLDASMPFSTPVLSDEFVRMMSRLRMRVVKFFGKVGIAFKNFARNLVVLVSIPTSLAEQARHSMDNNALHGPPLTGEKIISCWMESDFIDESQDYGLLAKIRDIKNSTGTRFGDVVLAALSANLHKCFIKLDEAAPKTVSVVIRARMSAPSKQLSLKNRFSVGLLPLCVGEVNGKELPPEWYTTDKLQCNTLLDRLEDVSRCTESLRQKPDYLINYWVMTWLSAALPERMLKPFLKSYSTMVFSNLPGPSKIAILGNTLKKVAFWIPHRGTTGIGWSFLTYGGRAHFSVVADKGIVTNEKLLDDIITGTVGDIHKLHEYITMSCNSGKLRDESNAPTETGLSVP